jgi:hypothetical protein
MKIFIEVLLFFISASPKGSLLNTKHLDHLYQEVNVKNISIGFIHIYAEAPEYKWTDASGEGIACIDDAARAMVFYINYYNDTHDKKSLNKVKNLVNFHLYMQSDNGYFYNFILKDYSINKTYRTSLAEPNWWSWRALWALSEAYKFYLKKDPQFANEIKNHTDKLINVLLEWLIKENKTMDYGGYRLPAWLPYETAADQSAIIVKALSSYYTIDNSEKIKTAIEHLCSGIIKMQQGDNKTPPFCAFLSWQNTWHSWGNSQSDALIDAGKVLSNNDYIEASTKEIKYFYPWLIDHGYFSGFTVMKDIINVPALHDTLKFSQIAYGIRPIIFSCMNAYTKLKDSVYLNTALSAVKWFFKNNPADALMYDPSTGRGYDGIIGYGKINTNSGAESTIESLLSIQKLEKDKDVKNLLMKIYHEQLN